MIHPDGIHFQSLRYLDPVLAAYVGESVISREVVETARESLVIGTL